MEIKLGKWTAPVFFVAGVVTAKKWPQIRKRYKKYIVPVEQMVAGACTSFVGFVSQGKKQLEEFISEKKQKPKEEIKFKGKANPEQAILSVLKENKGGKTLGELAGLIGVPAITLAMPSKKLLEAGKIRKKEKKYFLAETKGGEI